MADIVTKQDANAIRDKVQAMFAASPALAAAAMIEWNATCDAIGDAMLKMRPKPLSYEVHHATQVARLAFLSAVASGNAATAKSAALKSINIEPKD